MKRASAIATLLVALIFGCGGTVEGPVPIVRGAECPTCGMEVQNLRYACERIGPDGMRMYDSIECLLRDSEAKGAAWFADYDSKTLHAVDSMWLVRGNIPSPMGGGLAAFMERAAADEVALQTKGSVTHAAAELPKRPGDAS